MSDSDLSNSQQQIIEALKVVPAFEAEKEIERRVTFLCDYLIRSGCRCLVLGISGGVDSTTAGMLSQRAAERARQRGHDATFIAMRLPYGAQKDEADAKLAIETIRADRVLTVDIKPAADAMLAALKAGGLRFRDAPHEDFVLGNIKARERMIAQYAVAGAENGLVIGTDHAAEALVGFFTKFGDGACDVTPLTGLNKRRVRAVAKAMGAPDELVNKIPTADLESLVPLQPDEVALGVAYAEIDDFLEGKPVSEEALRTILRHYGKTAHKRALPADPFPDA